VTAAQTILAVSDEWDAAGHTSEAIELNFAMLRFCRSTAGKHRSCRVCKLGAAFDALTGEHLRQWGDAFPEENRRNSAKSPGGWNVRHPRAHSFWNPTNVKTTSVSARRSHFATPP